MSYFDTMFTRELLKQVVADVRKHRPDIYLRDAWVWNLDARRRQLGKQGERA